MQTHYTLGIEMQPFRIRIEAKDPTPEYFVTVQAYPLKIEGYPYNFMLETEEDGGTFRVHECVTGGAAGVWHYTAHQAVSALIANLNDGGVDKLNAMIELYKNNPAN